MLSLPTNTLRLGALENGKIKHKVFFEPTDRRKSTKVLHNKHTISFASPNLSELRAMASFIKPDIIQKEKDPKDSLNEIIQLSTELSRFIKLIVVTIGSRGVVTITMQNDGQNPDRLHVKYYPVDPLKNVENVSGAGDCFSSGLIHGILSGLKESHCVSIGFKAAKLTLLSKNTVACDLNSVNPSLLKESYFMEIK